MIMHNNHNDANDDANDDDDDDDDGIARNTNKNIANGNNALYKKEDDHHYQNEDDDCNDFEISKPLASSSITTSSQQQIQQMRRRRRESSPSSSSSNILVPPKEQEEELLLQDTFSLLMIAKYPKRQLLFLWKYLCCGCLWNLLFSSCCCNNNTTNNSQMNGFPSPRRNSSKDNDEEDDSDDEEAPQQQQQQVQNDIMQRNDNNGTTKRQRIRQERRRRRKQIKESKNNKNKITATTDKTTTTNTTIVNSTSTFRREEDYAYLPFWIAWGVFLIQMFIYFIVLADTISNGVIPPNVDIWLRLAQIVAVLITIITQSDLIDGIYLLHEGHTTFLDITTRWKFRISTLMRIVSGIVGVTATFILIVYSNEVVELLLNFTAMEFVATFDDSIFRIASMGFLGSTLSTKSAIITGYRYTPHHTTKDGGKIKSRYHCYLLAVALVLVAFGIIWGLQVTRTLFADNEVYVQFDDTNTPELFGISGVYKGCKFKYGGPGFGPIIYVSVSQPCPSLFVFPPNAFYYCTEQEGWVYTRNSDERVCRSGLYLLRSSKERSEWQRSDAYNILTHANANWIYKRPTTIGGEIILDDDGMFIHAIQKYENVFGQCFTMDLYHTTKDTIHVGVVNQEDQEGSSPDIVNRPSNLSNLEVDYFPSFNDETYNIIFGLMYRPIFQRPVDDGREGKFHVLLYYGLRWIYLDLDPVAFSDFAINDEFYAESTKTVDPTLFCDNNDNNNVNVDDPHCWRPFVKHFLSNDAWLFNKTIANVTAISDPMILLTGTDTGFPTSGLQWYEVQKVEKEYRYLQPTRPLPISEESGSSLTNVTTPTIIDDRSYYFQCDVFEGTTCKEGNSLLWIDVTTDIFPQDTNLIAFLGQGVDDYEPNKTANDLPIVVKSEDHITMPDIVDDNVVLDVRFADREARHRLSTCVPSTKCVQVVFIQLRSTFRPPGRHDIYYNNTLKDIYIATSWASARNDKCLVYQYGSNCKDLGRPSLTRCSFTVDELGNVLLSDDSKNSL